MTPPPLQSVRRRPASIVVAVLLIGLSVPWSVVIAVVEDTGRIGANVFTVFLAFVLGVALWQGTRVGWVVALALGVVWTLVAGLVLLADDSDSGRISAVIGAGAGALLVVALLLPACRDYCWGKKPGF